MSGRIGRQYIQYVGKCKCFRLGSTEDVPCQCQCRIPSQYPSDASSPLSPEYFSDDTYSTESDNSYPPGGDGSTALPSSYFDDTYSTDSSDEPPSEDGGNAAPIQDYMPPNAPREEAPPTTMPPTPGPPTPEVPPASDGATEVFDPLQYFVPKNGAGSGEPTHPPTTIPGPAVLPPVADTPSALVVPPPATTTSGTRYVRLKTGQIAVYKWESPVMPPPNLWTPSPGPLQWGQAIAKPMLGILGVGGAIGIAYMLMKKR